MLIGASTACNTNPAAAPSLSRQPTASAPSLSERPSILLQLVAGSADGPGVVPAAPGGVAARGPQSVIVEQGRIYVWDEANLRVLIYDGQSRSGAVSLRDARVQSRALVFENDRFYLREQDDAGTAMYEDEFDASSGARLRTAAVRFGEASLYPRVRFAPPIVGTPKGSSLPLGVDASGNRYEIFTPTSCAGASCNEVHRVDRTGTVTASVTVPEAARFEDLAIARDGGVYGLQWDRDGSGRVTGMTVQRLFSPLR